MSNSIKNVINSINKNGLESSYFLLGDDLFMQKFFINKIRDKSENSDSIICKYFYLNEDNDLDLFFNEITSLSLFNNNDLFIIKNFNRISKDHQDVLMNYMNNLSTNNTIIFILDDFKINNKFSQKISEKSVIVNTQTPKKIKIKNWIKFYYKNEGISIDDNVLKCFIDNYSDDITTIINEIEKHYLFSNDKHINFNLNDENIYYSKHIKAWNLLDALGRKDIDNSISYYNNLYVNGSSLVFLLILLNNFYFELYSALNGVRNSYSSLNRTLQGNMNLYKNNYRIDELVRIFIELRNLDVKIKTTSINEQVLFSSTMIKICNSYYNDK
tara:strand:+ start:1129 stop:2112 length:984 start_codon:yes stop_codon:yes gene_type:complete